MQRKKCMMVFLVVVMSMLMTSLACAASLWTDNAPAASLFADRKARNVGDLLTIIISESTSAVRVGKADNTKSANISGDAGVGIFNWLTSNGAKASDSFQAQGSISNTNSVKAKITVQVAEVKPNGNLIVTGTQVIKQSTDEQKITITGEVRPDDVLSDNTVLSTYVANAQIKIEGKGPIANKQRQGILTQIFNILF